LAERRSDIFGTGVEETDIGKKPGEEERRPGMPWNPNVGLSSDFDEDDYELAPGTSEDSDNKHNEGPNRDSIGPK